MTITDHQVRQHFLKVKDHLDQVMYSLIRTTDHDLADELFIRIREGETTFAQMARIYSQGPEAKTGGIIGPAPLKQVHPLLVEALRSSEPGQVIKPFWFKQFSIILRLEDYIQARFKDHEKNIRTALDPQNKLTSTHPGI